MSPKKTPDLPCDIYVRVSRVGGRSGETFISPGEQEKRARAYLASRGFKVGEVFTDLDKTGRNMERPQLEIAMERIRNKVSGGICVAKLDRFGRTVIGALKGVDEIEEHGAAFLCVEPTVDTTTAMGRFALQLFAALAELESRRIGENWEVAKSSYRERGGYLSSRVPFGYRRLKGGGLEPDKKTAPYVERVFRMRAEGDSWSKVSAMLDDAGMRTPLLGDGSGKTAGGGRWAQTSLRKMVMNPLYRGKPKGGEQVEGIVSARLWASAQSDRNGTRTRGELGTMLSGLVRCGSCGGLLTPDKKGDGSRVYRCRQRSVTAVPCRHRVVISGSLIEPFVAAETERLLAGTWRAVDEAYAEKGGVTELTEAFKDAVFERDEFERTAIADGLTPAQISRMLAQYEQRIEQASAALDDARARVDVIRVEPKPGMIESLRPSKQRDLLKRVFTGVYVSPGKGREDLAARVRFEVKT
jgi:site-specific DNA recombinase